MTLYQFLFAIFLFVSSSKANAFPLKIARQEGFDKISAIVEVEDFVRKALADEDIQVVFTSLPLTRSTAMVSRGELDGEMIRAVSIIEKNPNLILSSKPLGYADYHILFSSDNPRFDQHNLKKLKGLILLNSTIARDELHKRNLKVGEASSLEQGLKMVTSGQADYIILAVPVINATKDVRPDLFENLKTADEKFERIPLYFCLNNKYKDLMPKIEKAFSRQIKKKNHYKYANKFLNPNL